MLSDVLLVEFFHLSFLSLLYLYSNKINILLGHNNNNNNKKCILYNKQVFLLSLIVFPISMYNSLLYEKYLFILVKVVLWFKIIYSSYYK